MPRLPVVLTPAQAARVPTWRAAYSDRTSALMAAMCELAYVPFEEAPTPRAPGAPKAETPTGRADLEARLAAGGFQLVAVFNTGDTQAFLALDPAEFAVLAFRGTTDAGDWNTDLNVGRVPLDGAPANVTVHRGFYEAFQDCRDEITLAVNSQVPSDLGLYITGHSLGGALAQIASAALERDNLAACYTFGSPRVGTIGFDRQVKCPHYRVVNSWDAVPGVPAPWFWGYHHSGDPRLLTKASAHGSEALRRDRDPISRFIVDLWALAAVVVTHRLPIIDDHMIWNYRTKLEAIAAVRGARPTTATTAA